jgi:hypothetical protein
MGKLATASCLVLSVSACRITDDESQSAVARRRAQTITYVGKQSLTDFTGLGQHLQYWPLFGRTSPQTARRTDDEDCIELTPDFADFKHHYLPDGRTFSNDALGSPIGTKTRGGYAAWPMFTLPDGRVGRSGTFYDESNIDNKNNTVNQIRINVPTLTEFCLNLITDNTNGEHDPNVLLEARSDTVDLSLEGHPDLTFDGVTDMYTFRYRGMTEDNVFKVRFECSAASGCQGAGLGGFMVSHISTCSDASAPDAGMTTPDAGATAGDDAGTGGGADNGEPAGCGCRSSTGAPDCLLLVTLACGLVVRRRRGHQSVGQPQQGRAAA